MGNGTREDCLCSRCRVQGLDGRDWPCKEEERQLPIFGGSVSGKCTIFAGLLAGKSRRLWSPRWSGFGVEPGLIRLRAHAN